MKILLSNLEEKLLYLAIFFVVLFINETLLFLFLGVDKTLLFWSMPVQFLFFSIIFNRSFPSLNQINAKLVFTGLTAFVIFNSFFFQPGSLEYHDQGVYSNAAIYFTKNNSFVFTQDHIDTLGGLSRRYNGEGFVIHKSPAYIAYLSPFYFFFGYSGFPIANAILFFFSLLSIHLLAQYFISKRLSFIPLIFTIIAFPIFWFSRTTFSEIMMMFIFWATLYSLFKAKEKKSGLYFLIPFFSAPLFILTRYEGFTFSGIFVIFIIALFLWAERAREWKAFKEIFSNRLYIFILLFGFFELALVAVYHYSFITPIYEENIASSIDWLFRGVTSQSPESPTHYPYNFNIFLITFSFFSFYSYGLAAFLLASIAGAFYELKKRGKSFRDMLLIAIISAPGLYFFINPSISLYHPWAARRWFPVLIPVVILVASIYLIKLIKNKKLLALIISALFVLNTIKIIPSFFIINGQGVPEMINKIGTRLPENIPVFFWDTYGIDYYAAPVYFNYQGEIYRYEQYREIDTRLGLKEAINRDDFIKIIKKSEKAFLISGLSIPNLQTTYLRDFNIQELASDDFQLNWVKSEGNARDLTYYPQMFTGYLDMQELFEGLPPHETVIQKIHVNYYLVTP